MTIQYHPGLRKAVIEGSYPAVEPGIVSAIDESTKTLEVCLLDTARLIKDVPMASTYYAKGTGDQRLPEVNSIVLVWWMSHQRPFVFGALPLQSYAAGGTPDYSGRAGGTEVTSDHMQPGEQEQVGPMKQYTRMDKDGNIMMSDSGMDSVQLVRSLGMKRTEAMREDQQTELGSVYRGVFTVFDKKKGFVEAKDNDAYFPVEISRFYRTADAKLNNYDSDEELIRAILDRVVVVSKKKRYPVYSRYLANVVNPKTLKRRKNTRTDKELISRVLMQDEAEGTTVTQHDIDVEGAHYIQIAGQVDLYIGKDLCMKVDKGITLHVKGPVNIKSDAVVNIDAPKINLNCGGAKAITELPIKPDKMDIDKLGEEEQQILGVKS